MRILAAFALVLTLAGCGTQTDPNIDAMIDARVKAAVATAIAQITPVPGPTGPRGLQGLTGPAGLSGASASVTNAQRDVDDLTYNLYGFSGPAFSASNDVGNLKSDVRSICSRLGLFCRS